MNKPVSTLATMVQVGRTFGMRDGMLRLEYELQRGSGLMSWRMRSVHGWNAWDLDQIAPGVKAEDLLTTRRNGTRRFFFADVRTLAPRIREIIGSDGEHSVLAQAENILRGHLPFFGDLAFDCGFPPDWFRNPLTGQSVSPDERWTQMRFASPVYGDLKFILEPSRFLFVYPLVRAYALTGEERFPEAFWQAIENWARCNPPMSGPLWICGQECSLRILAWSLALHGFIHSASTTCERVALLTSMIAAHAWRTPQTLGYARSQRSNHLISEAIGLWTAGVLYPELREAQVWRRLGAQLLQEAVLDQITPEGVLQQHSFNYQRMILHLLLWAVRLAQVTGAPLAEQIRIRTEAAYDFMRQWIDPVSGRVPNYGSDDGSLIFPLAQAAYRDFRPLMQLGATVLDRPPLPAGSWDEPTVWFGAKASVKAACAPPASADTGYFRLGDETSWAMIRAGHYSRRPYQADQLHVDLWWNGTNLALDPGTYLYNGDAPWNNGFAGTAVHNTITVDHRDQMRRGGRFLWLDWAQAQGRVSVAPGQRFASHFEGEHDGYRRLGVKHRRMVDWLPEAGWVIVDEVEGSGTHNVRLHWLMPDMPYETSGPEFQVTLRSQQGNIRWNISAGGLGRAAIVRAGKQVWATEPATELRRTEMQLLGWESLTYGDLRPAISLVHQTRAPLPIRFTTVVLTDDRCQVRREPTQLTILRYESAIYRIANV